MLVTFSSKNSADLLMLAHHALPLIAAAGKDVAASLPERGIITVAQLDTAIAGLSRAIAEADPVADDDEEDDLDAAPVPPMARPVGVAQRAYPLLDLLRKAQEHGDDVIWETSRGY